MRLTRLDHKLMAGIAGLFLLPAFLSGGVLVALYRWGAFEDAFTLLVTVVVGLIAMMAYLGLIAHAVGRSLVRTVQQIQLGTELMTSVNPAHRLHVPTGDEFQFLAEEINGLADRLQGTGAVPGARRGEGHRLIPLMAGRPDRAATSRHDPAGQGRSSAARGRPLDEVVFTVFDLETTGLEAARGDRIVSIACVRVCGGIVEPGEVLATLVNPGRPIPLDSSRIHGITDAMVAHSPTIDEILPFWLRFTRDTVLVGHEVWFDLGFLREATDRLRLPPLTRSHRVLDTRSLSELVHASLTDHDLDTVAVRLGIAVQNRHSALGDALITADILLALLRLLRARGVRTLGDSLAAVRRIGRPPSGR